jgi:hypothetical protein
MLRRAFVTPDGVLFATEIPHVLEISATIAPDGSGATIKLFLNTGRVAFEVDPTELTKMINTLRAASSQIAARKRYAHDWGRAWLADLCATAPRPAEITVRVDPQNGDRLFLMQFDNQAPIALRNTVEDVQRVIESLMRITRQTAQ